jgi:hypothetical protein
MCGRRRWCLVGELVVWTLKDVWLRLSRFFVTVIMELVLIRRYKAQATRTKSEGDVKVE